MNTTDQRGTSPALTWVTLAVWCGAAFLIGASGVLARLTVPPPAIAVVITAALLIALGASPAMRMRVRTLGLPTLVAFHAVRIAAGIYFLLLYRRGEMPREFAVVAGLGDVAVGVGALIVCWFCFPLHSGMQRTTLLTWNALGLLDILVVLANGIRLFLRDPSLADVFTRLPLAMLPTFVVPMVIVSHVLLFAWAPDARRVRL